MEYIYIYIGDFILSICFLFIHVSECVFYYPSFRVCFLLPMFQSIFILSMFQGMSSIIHVSEYGFNCKQNNSLYKICWRYSFASFLDIITHIVWSTINVILGENYSHRTVKQITGQISSKYEPINFPCYAYKIFCDIWLELGRLAGFPSQIVRSYVWSNLWIRKHRCRLGGTECYASTNPRLRTVNTQTFWSGGDPDVGSKRRAGKSCALWSHFDGSQVWVRLDPESWWFPS